MTARSHRDLYATIWQLREVDGIPWSQISARLDIPESSLAKIPARPHPGWCRSQGSKRPRAMVAA
jgi:hypothetical protein